MTEWIFQYVMTSTECFSVYIRTIFLCNKSLTVRFLTVDKGKKTKNWLSEPFTLKFTQNKICVYKFYT